MTRHIYCAIALSLIFQSDAMAESTYQTYGKKGFDECYDKTLSGEQIVVPCPTGPQVMTTAEIQESLDQFRAFEESDLVEKVFEAARKRDALPTRLEPLGKKIPAKGESVEQKSAHTQRIQDYLEFQSQFSPEVVKKMGGIENNRYRITIAFSNNGNFPKKHSNSDVFIDNVTDSFADDWKAIIFNHYLKNGYEQYEPSLGAVHEVVVIKVLVDNRDDLARLVENQPVESISHIGNPVGGIDESAHLPVKINQ